MIARTSSSPAMLTGRESPSSTPRATVETASQGRRSSGVASRAASLTTPTGRPLPVTVTIAPAWASRARRTASASGRSSGTARVRRARLRATRCGSRRRTLAAWSEAVAPFQRKRPMTKARRKSKTSGSTSSSALLRERPEQDGDRGDPAAPRRDDGAAVHAAGELPDRGLEHPAAVQREPRHQVEGADQQVAEGQPLDDHQQQPVGHHEPQAERGERPPPARSAARPRRSRTPAAASWPPPRSR